jgi:P-type Cu2+ transporter
MGTCLHCGLDVAGGEEFCCRGCQAAHGVIQGLGLESYYRRRTIDPNEKPLRPDDDETARDFSAYVRQEADGTCVLHLMVGGLHCAACVWLIENVLSRSPGVVSARLNMTTRRLIVKWRPGETHAGDLARSVAALGYRVAPYDPALLTADSTERERSLLRAMAVAGFAAANVMLMSVSVWSGDALDMGPGARGLLHWVSALIALPATAYAGRHFFRSALAVLRRGHANMDVPISLALVLTAGMSLAETVRGSEHVYFDSVLTLLFFLLIGRYLDLRARGRARSVGEHLLALAASAVTVIDASGARRLVPPAQVEPGMTVLTAAGERISVDGLVAEGSSDIDRSLITGETLPRAVAPGGTVEAGTLNLSAPLKIRVTAAGEDTLLAEIVRLMEDAEQGRSRYVALADRVARYYSPVVHALALVTFLVWAVGLGTDWRDALLHATAVLIITCPCALALAVPAVQVVAGGRLFRSGILLKSGTALERLAGIDRAVLDKTGTLTWGRLELVSTDAEAEERALAASMAATSRHPLSRALLRAGPDGAPAVGVSEVPGQGLSLATPLGEVRLGRRDWCGAEQAPSTDGPELWLSQPGVPARHFAFSDRLRSDADETVGALSALGLKPELLSGDREPVVAGIARAAGVASWRANALPADKVARLEELKAAGHRPLMVGDGINDAPALAAAWVSMSPASGADIAQNAADVVFQGDRLNPVIEALSVARRAEALVKQNIAFSLVYNSLTIPAAMAGYVTPLVAAVAMSSSSLVVIANALRLGRAGR